MASGFIAVFMSGIWLILAATCVTIAFGFDQWVLMDQSNCGLWSICIRDLCYWYWQESPDTYDTSLPCKYSYM